jgi:hypothetical protein
LFSIELDRSILTSEGTLVLLTGWLEGTNSAASLSRHHLVVRVVVLALLLWRLM